MHRRRENRSHDSDHESRHHRRRSRKDDYEFHRSDRARTSDYTDRNSDRQDRHTRRYWDDVRRHETSVRSRSHRRDSRENSNTSQLKESIAELTGVVKALSTTITARAASTRKATRSHSRHTSVSTASSQSRVSVSPDPLSVRRSVSNNLPSPKTNLPESLDRKVEKDIGLDDEDLQILGSAPSNIGIYGKAIHTELSQRWESACQKGLEPSILDKLMQEQKIPENCKFLVPPILNLEIEAASSDYCNERDRQLKSLQKKMGLSLAACGQVLTNILSTSKDEKLDRQSLLSSGCAAANLSLSAYHEISIHRKRIITPKQGILSKLAPAQVIDDYLFGCELKEKIKNAEELKKIGDSLVRPTTATKSKVTTPSSKSTKKVRPLNYRRPFNTGKSNYYRGRLSGHKKDIYKRK